MTSEGSRSFAARPRESLFHAATTSLCDDCLASVPAKVMLRGGRVYLHKHCLAHGFREDLLEEDAGWYLSRLQFDKPGTPTAPETSVCLGCPRDCGLCPDHDQHTCIGLIEITRACNLRCPACYASSSADDGRHLPLADAVARMDALVAAEGGEAQILQVSGGEPTLHPRVLDILAAALDRPIRWVMLNTNGIRIAEDPRFADALGALEGRFEVYLQFDGLDGRAERELRGRDLHETKLRALDALAEREVPVTLVMTAREGVNDGDIGRVVSFGIGRQGVRGVNIQPEAYFGRNGHRPSRDRLTLSGVLRRIEDQSAGMLKRGDFVPLPCDVDRVAIAYLVRRDGAFVPATRQEAIKRHLPLIENTLMFDTSDVLRKTAEALGRGQWCNCLSFLRDFLPLAPASLVFKSPEGQAEFVTNNTFRITVTSFLDRFNFEARAMKKECVHVITAGGKRVPFSAWNILHRSGEVPS